MDVLSSLKPPEIPGIKTQKKSIIVWVILLITAFGGGGGISSLIKGFFVEDTIRRVVQDEIRQEIRPMAKDLNELKTRFAVQRTEFEIERKKIESLEAAKREIIASYIKQNNVQKALELAKE